MSCKSCSPDLTVGPTPHYTTIENSTIQNHTQVFNDSCYPLGVPVEDQWVIPAEGSEVTLKINNLKDVPLGAYLYNPFYGYFKISHWNPKLGNVGVINDGVRGTQAAGTAVPAGTVFSVVDRPCCEDDATTVLPFVAEDFIAPNVSATRQIRVTSTFGLQVGDVVRIATGTYAITAISTIGFITIENEGDGLTPGINVVALDSVGDYQYLITRDIPNACESTAVNTSGAMVICNGRFPSLLQGGYKDAVPTKVNNTISNQVAYKIPDADIARAMVSVAPFNVVSGNNLAYPNLDSASFQNAIQVGDIVCLPYETESALRFKVTQITGPTYELVGFNGLGTFPTTKTFAAGTVVRRVPPNEFARLSDPTIILPNLSVAGASPNTHVVSFSSGDPYYAGNVSKITSAVPPKGTRFIVTPVYTSGVLCNSGPATFNPTGTAMPIEVMSSTGVLRPLIGGELAHRVPYTVESNGVDKYILVDFTPMYRLVQTSSVSHLTDLTVATCDTTLEYKNNGADIDIHILLDSLTISSSAFMDSISFNFSTLLGVSDLINADFGRILPGEYINPSGGAYMYGRVPNTNNIQLVREGFINFAVGSSQRIVVSGKVKR